MPGIRILPNQPKASVRRDSSASEFNAISTDDEVSNEEKPIAITGPAKTVSRGMEPYELSDDKVEVDTDSE